LTNVKTIISTHAHRSRQTPKPAGRMPDHIFWEMAHKLGAMSESDRIQNIKIGFTADLAEATKQTFKLSSQSIGVLLNLSVATFERRRRDAKPLDAVASERLDRIAAIALMAKEVFEDAAAAAEWMATPNPALNGNPPIMHCETSIGARQVRRILNALEWGGVA